MLDDLLGRTELKERIEELEEEKRHLERQLEAEQDRRREAVADRQDAEERVNRLEDRIADLEGRLEAVDDDDEERDVGPAHTADLHGERLREVLARLESVGTGPESALTTALTEGGDLPEALSGLPGVRVGAVRRVTPCVVCADDAGLVRVALAPPITPDPFLEWADGFRLDREWFLPAGQFALALVRADLFAVGTYEDDERVTFDGFESDVRDNHSKGGYSQARFERLRDEQIDDHLTQCREGLSEVDSNRLYVTGDRHLIGEFADRADATAAVDATGEPEPALADAFREFWTTRLYGL